MAERILNLKLIYKGKHLDTAKFGRDFKNKFYIGRNKHLFWQILNNDFPDRHLFLKRYKNNYKIFLRSKMNFVIKKDGREIDKNILRKKNLLKNNNIIINEDTSGVIEICSDWQIEFQFNTPYKYVPIPEEVAILKEFSQWPALSREQKISRNILLVGLLLVVMFAVLVEQFYIPPPKFDLSERLRKIDLNATQVIPEYLEEEVPEVHVQTEEEEGEPQEIEDQGDEEGKEKAIAGFEEMFGVEYNAGDNYEGELFEFDVVSEIVVLGPSSETVSKTRPTTTSERMSVLEKASNQSLDISDLDSDLTGFEELDLGSEFDLEEIDVSSLSSEVENFQVTKVKSKAQFEEVKRKFSTLTTIKESSIELKEISPEIKTEVATINQVVNAYKPQITKLYIVERMYMDMYGSLEIVLYIEENGSIAAVDIIPAQGSFFTDSFLQKAQEIALKWKIPVTRAVPYSFRMKFIKQ